MSASSETRGETVFRLVAIQGTSAWATGLAAYGVVRRHKVATTLGLVLLYGISIPLMLGTSGFFTLASAIMFSVAASTRPSRRRLAAQAAT